MTAPVCETLVLTDTERESVDVVDGTQLLENETLTDEDGDTPRVSDAVTVGVSEGVRVCVGVVEGVIFAEAVLLGVCVGVTTGVMVATGVPADDPV